MSLSLEESYRYCQRCARASAKNFYFSFLVLSRPKRRAMCALYAFLRHTDDLSDNPQPADIRKAALDQWRRSLTRAFAAEYEHPLMPALADTVARYQVDPAWLEAVIDGVEMDLQRRRFEDTAELIEYCEKVASAVGMACIRIWGCDDPAADEPARQLGLAFQWTNILRDLKEDIDIDRVYLPQADLRRFAYSEADLRAGVRDARLQRLLDYEIAQAKRFYAGGTALHDYLPPDGRAVLGAMVDIYHGLLDEIEHAGVDVLLRRVRLSRLRKSWIAAKWMLLPPKHTATRAIAGAPD